MLDEFILNRYILTCLEKAEPHINDKVCIFECPQVPSKYLKDFAYKVLEAYNLPRVIICINVELTYTDKRGMFCVGIEKTTENNNSFIDIFKKLEAKGIVRHANKRNDENMILMEADLFSQFKMEVNAYYGYFGRSGFQTQRYTTNSVNVDLVKAQAKLNCLIGLKQVKEEISYLVKQIQTHQTKKYDLVFYGNPGTGITTVAKLIARIYHSLGILSKGHLIEADESSLCGQSSAETIVKTNKKIEEATGGILLINNAYSLLQDSATNNKKTAFNTILSKLENNRKNFVIIFSCKPEHLSNFINLAPRLDNYVNRCIHFEDYNADELFMVFRSFSIEREYMYYENCTEFIKEYLSSICADEEKRKENIHIIRDLMIKAIYRQKNRIPIDKEKIVFIKEDFM